MGLSVLYTLVAFASLSAVTLAVLPWAAWDLAGTCLFALCEEVIWRGIVLRLLSPRLGSLLALFLSAVAFAVWHERWNAPSLIELTLSGLLFGAAYLCTRRLWLSFGLHAGWNLGLNVYIEGGPQGSPSGFLATAAAQLVVIAVLLVIAHRRGRLDRAPWRGRSAPRPGRPAAPRVPAPDVPAALDG